MSKLNQRLYKLENQHKASAAQAIPENEIAAQRYLRLLDMTLVTKGVSCSERQYTPEEAYQVMQGMVK